MGDGTRRWRLVEFYFGDAGGGSSRRPQFWGEREERRLEWWEAAFGMWLGEQGEPGKGRHKQAVQAWRRLAKMSGILPWELTQENVAGHARWLEAEGYAASTIAGALGAMESFYRWCDAHQVDPICSKGFNPAKGVLRPQVRRYKQVDGSPAVMLSPAEVEALLGTVERDNTPLGWRDRAFLVARLQLGVSLKLLQHLTWGQLVREDGATWVRWLFDPKNRSAADPENRSAVDPKSGSTRDERLERLPGETARAIYGYLLMSGRLRGDQEAVGGIFIFAPLAKPGKAESGELARHWLEGQPLSTDQLLRNLKHYGRLAGIAEEKLTLMALRRTAIRMRMEAGASLEELQAFTGSRVTLRTTRYRLKRLPKQAEGAEGLIWEAEPPPRKAKPFQTGDGLKHGMYAKSQPAREVREVLRENVQGMGEELAGLRLLGRGLLERWRKALAASSIQEAARLGEAYSRVAYRLADLVLGEAEADEVRRKEKRSRSGGRRRAAAQFEAWEAIFEATEDEVELGMGDQRLAEEMAGLRYVLRNVLRLAMETERTEDYLRLVETYGLGCVRLRRLGRFEEGLRRRLGGTRREEALLGALSEMEEEMGR